MLVGIAAAPAPASGSDPGRVNGSGRTANAANFFVKVRAQKPERGQFKYTSVDGRFKIRCDGFDTYSPRVYVVPGAPAVIVAAEDCELTGPRKKRTSVAVEAEFVDNSSFKRGAKDEANFTFTHSDGTVTDSGRILSGDIVVR